MDIDHLAMNLFYAFEEGNRLQPLWDNLSEPNQERWLKVAKFVLDQEQYIKRVRVDNKVEPFKTEAV